MDNHNGSYEQQLLAVFESCLLEGHKELREVDLPCLCSKLQLVDEVENLKYYIHKNVPKRQTISYEEFRNGLLALLASKQESSIDTCNEITIQPIESNKDSVACESSPQDDKTIYSCCLGKKMELSDTVIKKSFKEYEMMDYWKQSHVYSVSTKTDIDNLQIVSECLEFPVLPEHVVQHLFEQLDENKDGLINQDEFFSAFQSLKNVNRNLAVDWHDDNCRNLSRSDVKEKSLKISEYYTSFLDSVVIVNLWGSAGVSKPATLLSDLGFNETNINLVDLITVLCDEIKSFSETSDQTLVSSHINLFKALIVLYQEEIRYLNVNIENLRVERDKLRIDVTNVNERMKVLTLELDERHSNHESQTQNILKQMEQRHANAIKEFSEQLVVERDANIAAMNEKQQEYQHLQQEQYNTKSKLTKALIENQQLEVENERLRDQVNKLKNTNDEWLQQIKILAAEHDEFQEKEKKEQEDVLCFVERIKQLQSEVSALRDQNDELVTELESLKCLRNDLKHNKSNLSQSNSPPRSLQSCESLEYGMFNNQSLLDLNKSIKELARLTGLANDRSFIENIDTEDLNINDVKKLKSFILYMLKSISSLVKNCDYKEYTNEFNMQNANNDSDSDMESQKQPVKSLAYELETIGSFNSSSTAFNHENSITYLELRTKIAKIIDGMNMKLELLNNFIDDQFWKESNELIRKELKNLLFEINSNSSINSLEIKLTEVITEIDSKIKIQSFNTHSDSSTNYEFDSSSVMIDSKKQLIKHLNDLLTENEITLKEQIITLIRALENDYDILNVKISENSISSSINNIISDADNIRYNLDEKIIDKSQILEESVNSDNPSEIYNKVNPEKGSTLRDYPPRKDDFTVIEQNKNKKDKHSSKSELNYSNEDENMETVTLRNYPPLKKDSANVNLQRSRKEKNINLNKKLLAQPEIEINSATEREQLIERCNNLERSLELLKAEYDECEDYWASKLEEERQLFEQEQKISDEKLSELIIKMAEYEELISLPEKNIIDGRLSPIEEKYTLERQYLDLEEEFEEWKIKIQSEISERDEKIRKLEIQLKLLEPPLQSDICTQIPDEFYYNNTRNILNNTQNSFLRKNHSRTETAKAFNDEQIDNSSQYKYIPQDASHLPSYNNFNRINNPSKTGMQIYCQTDSNYDNSYLKKDNRGMMGNDTKMSSERTNNVPEQLINNKINSITVSHENGKLNEITMNNCNESTCGISNTDTTIDQEKSSLVNCPFSSTDKNNKCASHPILGSTSENKLNKCNTQKFTINEAQSYIEIENLISSNLTQTNKQENILLIKENKKLMREIMKLKKAKIVENNFTQDIQGTVCRIDVNVLQGLKAKLQSQEQKCHKLQQILVHQQQHYEKIIQRIWTQQKMQQTELQFLLRSTQERLQLRMRECALQADKLVRADIIVKELYVENARLSANMKRMEERSRM